MIPNSSKHIQPNILHGNISKNSNQQQSCRRRENLFHPAWNPLNQISPHQVTVLSEATPRGNILGQSKVDNQRGWLRWSYSWPRPCRESLRQLQLSRAAVSYCRAAAAQRRIDLSEIRTPQRKLSPHMCSAAR